MTFLPIVARELRVAARRSSTYWIRAGAAGLCLLIALWAIVTMRHADPAQLGMGFFGLLSGSAVLYCLFAGVRWTSDCLSQEKREGTLGLLFLTDLKGYDVVLGKFVANSMAAVYGVLAVVPILALPLLLGGVTIGEVGRMALLALNTIFFSLSLGIAVSASVRSSRVASGSVVLVLLVLTALLPVLGAWLESEKKIPANHPLFFYPSAGYSYFWAYDMNFRRGAPYFWGSIATIHTLAWLLLVFAAAVAPRSWQDRPSGSLAVGWRARLRSAFYASPESAARLRAGMLDQNPVYWLIGRSPIRRFLVWLALFGGALLWVWGWAEQGDDWISEPVFVLTGLVLNLVFKSWVAAECGRHFADDRQHGALELLLSTPLELREIFRGQWLALQRQFLGPFILIQFVFLLFMTLTVRKGFAGSDDNEFWTMFWTAGMMMLLADCYAMYWVGMWQGISARNPNRVAAETASRIMVLPWLGIAGFMLMVALGAANGGGIDMSPTGFLMLWLILGLLVDVILGFLAYDRLHAQFRELAAKKYLPRKTLWDRFFSKD